MEEEEAKPPELQEVENEVEVTSEENTKGEAVEESKAIEENEETKTEIKESEICDEKTEVDVVTCEKESSAPKTEQLDYSKHLVPKSPVEIDRITNFTSSSSSSSSSRSCSRERTPSVVVIQRLNEDTPSPAEVTTSPNFKHSDGEVCFNTMGPRYKIIWEGDLQVCYLNHTRTVISKILSSKFLRRWESHRLYLNDSCISSKTVSKTEGIQLFIFYYIIFKRL